MQMRLKKVRLASRGWSHDARTPSVLGSVAHATPLTRRLILLRYDWYARANQTLMFISIGSPWQDFFLRLQKLVLV